jgi:hypothetical protein
VSSTSSHQVHAIGATLVRWLRALRDRETRRAGPLVARAFHLLLGLIFLDAFVSLGSQLRVLIGSRGLLPAAPLLEALRERSDISWLNFPTLFWIDASDTTLLAGCWLGAALAIAAAAGLRSRLCFALLVPLYLGYATVARSFLSFQWDNLLLECGLLAVFLPRDRPALWIHMLLRLLLWKLYFESGLAKWQSSLGDWYDGSAMTFYYETAPIPTWLAWYAHALPESWHQLESRLTLIVELVLPLGIFGPRRARLTALVVLMGFQLLNLATANYGFFVHLAVALHVFLLDEADLVRLRRFAANWLPRWPRRRDPREPPRPRRLLRLRRAGAAVLAASFLGISSIEGIRAFADWPAFNRAVSPLRSVYSPFRLVNVYHLFAQITRERIEPGFQTRAGSVWTEHALWYKPGPLDRPPPFVAPHQPRVDFALWFYGLGFRRSTPEYVQNLIARLCLDPAAVQPLFTSKLPDAPDAVRIVFGRYQFAAADDGAYWTRRDVAELGPVSCDTL